MSEPGRVIQFTPRDHREPYLTKRQLADELGVSVRWIEYRMKEPGFPRHEWTARMVRFRYSEVVRWLETRKAS